MATASVPSIAPETKARIQGFDAYYTRDIEPWLAEQEDGRKRLLAQARRRWLLAAPFALAAAGIMIATSGADDNTGPLLLVLLLAAPAAGLAYWGYAPLRSLRGQIKSELCARVFGYFNYSYIERPDPALLLTYLEAGILPGHDRARVEDAVRGHLNGVSFDIAEAHLEERRTTTDSKGRTQTTYVTVFRGLIGRFTFPRAFKGRTLIARDAGFFGNALSGLFRKPERIALEDPVFEKRFEVFGTDQVEARYLLTPAFMERLLALDDMTEAKLTAGFFDQRFLIALNGGRDRFEAGSIWRDVSDPSHVKALVQDIAIIADIVNTLRLDLVTKV